MTEEEVLKLKEEIKEEIRAEKKYKKKHKKKKEKTNHLAEVELEDHDLFYTRSEPQKTFATYMRNQNKFYVNSLNVIDRKAAMMIRVNSTIISGIVLLFQYVQEIENGTAIGIVMVIFSFISLISAINASKPYVQSIAKGYRAMVSKRYPEIEKNLFAIGMYPNVSLEEYELAFDKLLKSQELQVGSQVRAMYAFEKQINRAFIQIDLSFGAFIIGFLLSVCLFLFGAINGLI